MLPYGKQIRGGEQAVKEIIRSPHMGSILAVKWVTSMLSWIGNVTEFEVYRDPETCPYKSETNSREVYTLVLHGDNEVDFWVAEANCGYGGTGPHATVEILQMMGLKRDFSIYTDAPIFETNLEPCHRLNLVVGTDHGSLFRPQFTMTSDYPRAHKRMMAKDALSAFGSLIPLHSGETPEGLAALQQEYEWAEYKTNNRLVLDPEMVSDFSPSQIQAILRSVIQGTGGTCEFPDGSPARWMIPVLIR